VNRLIRIVHVSASLIGVALIFGCADELSAPSQPQFAVAAPSLEPELQFTSCKAEPSAVSSAWVGPKGGILRAGNHMLKVPPGALGSSVRITMESPSGSINRVVFKPEGLVFNAKARPHLVMNYSNCWVTSNAKQHVVYVDAALNVLEITPSTTDPAAGTVDATLKHFSEYVLLSTYAVVY
jgi:hypothetical protein